MATFQEALGKTMQAMPQIIQMYQQAYMQSRQMALQEKETEATVEYYKTANEKTRAELKHFKDIAPIELATRRTEKLTAEAQSYMAQLDSENYPEILREAHELHDATMSAQREIAATATDTRLTNESTRNMNDINMRLSANEATLNAMSTLEILSRPGMYQMAEAFWNESASKHNGVGNLTEVTDRMRREGMLKTPEEIRAFQGFASLADRMNNMSDAIAGSVGEKLMLGEMKSFKWTGKDGETYDMDAGRWFNGGATEFMQQHTTTADDIVAMLREKLQAQEIPADTGGGDNTFKRYGVLGVAGTGLSFVPDIATFLSMLVAGTPPENTRPPLAELYGRATGKTKE